MTIEGHHITRTGPVHSAQPGEDQPQAYVRRLHETNAQRHGTDQPQRGRDPWLGLAL